MNTKAILLTTALFVALIVGMCMYVYVNNYNKTTTNTDSYSDPVQIITEPDIKLITVQQQQVESGVVLRGVLQVPTPCHTIEAAVEISADQSQAALFLDTVTTADFCAAVVTTKEFMTTVVTEEVSWKAYLNDMPVDLRIIVEE